MGIVYILINGAMPGYTKIGKTTSPIEERMRGLDTTGVPLPFECFYAAQVQNQDEVERLLHDAFRDYRVRDRREFFTVDPERAQAALKLAKGEDVTPRNDIVADSSDRDAKDDQVALNKARRREHFNFEMLDIPIGTELVSTQDENLTCKIIGKKKIEFEGEDMSLSAAALKVAHRMGYDWTTIAGPNYWKYMDDSHGSETLAERRRRIEEED